jgi:hypothetical protein
LAAHRAHQPDPDNTDPDNDTADSSTADVGNVDKGAGKAARPMRDGLNGGKLLKGGTPGQKGGTGRPRRAFKEFARELADDPELQASVAKRAHKQATVLKMVLDHGAGMPEQKITLTHDTGALDRLFARLAPDPRALPDATVSELAPPQQAQTDLAARIPDDPPAPDHG